LIVDRGARFFRNEVIVVGLIAAVPPNEGRGSDVIEQYDRPIVAVRCFRGTGISKSCVRTLELKEEKARCE
jgi:hypothetical protein